MVRISAEVVNDSYQFINAVKQREICLRNLQIPTIENLGVTRDQFDVIDLSDNNIRKLDNLPRLKRLETLFLHNNRIQQIDKHIGEQLPNLKTLALTNNNVSEFGDIDPLAGCLKLEYLTLIGNPLTHKQHYRLYVIYKLKSVRVLDFRRIKLAEREMAKKMFKGSSGKRLRSEIVKQSEPLADDGAVDASTASAVRPRSDVEREKIKELIAGAKTLTEIENLENVLQAGKIPAALNPQQPFDGANNGMEMEDDEEEEAHPDNNGFTNGGGAENEGQSLDNGDRQVEEAGVTESQSPENQSMEAEDDAGGSQQHEKQSQVDSAGMEMEDEDD